jgi:xylulokinase
MLLNTCGTVELLVLCSDKPVCGPNHLLRTHAYRDRWLLMRTLGAGGASIEWVRSTFYKDMSRQDFYSGHIEKVLGSPRDTDVEFDPYLTGDRHRLEALSASLRNLTLDTTRDDILYSVAYNNAKFVLGIIPEWEKAGRIEKAIYHVGGGAGEGYTNIKKNMLKDYQFVNIGETAEKGAAIIGFGAMSNYP